MKIRIASYMGTLLMMILLAAGCKPALPAPVIVTVVKTMPVEVTRLVEMTVPVEVTREVFITQIVEVQVTPTPALSVTPTTKFSSVQATSIGGQPFSIDPSLTAVITPQAKGEGFTPVFVKSFVKERLEMYLRGPLNAMVVVNSGNVWKIWLTKGNYTYTVYNRSGLAYDGAFKIASSDKYEIHLYNKKAVILVP
ncbi:MAG: hypothetical protein A2W33_07905 [Chloroflexi bacterium RBG_16_52_11]|nr:MAG: hypothetical protein A2W33_07905 [Chloroflexi bacterium RBG_16_52_11]